MKQRILSVMLCLSLFLSLLGVLPVQAADSLTKVKSLTVGSFVCIVSEDVGMELTAISTTSTKYGMGTSYSGTPAGTMLFEVCHGASAGTYAFKNGEKYLYWGSGNSLNLNSELSEKTSWSVTFDSNGNASMLSSYDSARQLWWNNSATGLRFACYTGKTADKTYKSIQFYQTSAPVCFHTDSHYAYTGGKVCLVCNDCGKSEAVVMHSTADARAFTDEKVTYNVWGVVTYISGRTVYIEDATGGLCVYFATSVDTSALALGQKIFVTSNMTVYNGLPELDNPKEYLLISKDNSLPDTTNLSVADITGDTAMAHLGKRVTLSDLTIGVINPAGYTPLTDKSGNSISIYRAKGLPEELVAGNIVRVTAIISYYDDGFQLLLNPTTVASDVVKTGEGSAVSVETVPISTAKAGADETYYQVEGIVTCVHGRQIFIQDETGGIVIYLSSMPAEAPCAVGDKIRVYGAFGNYDGVLELQYVDHTDPAFFSILSSDNAVVSQPITIEELLRDSSVEYEYFAEKVFLNDVSILEIDTNGTVYLWQDDYTIPIYAAPVLNADCVVGAVVDVTATVSGYSYNYELVINSAADVVYGAECSHKETAALNQVNPTCTEEGYSGDIYCTVCGTYISAGYALPAEHSSFLINAVEPSCDAAGFTGDEYCELCETVVMYGSEIPPLGHDFVANVVSPTCTQNGCTIYSCTRCNGVYYDNEVLATGHTNSYVELDSSSHSYFCLVCGETGVEAHAFEGPVCTLCNAPSPNVEILVDETIKILHSLNLAGDISINFVVSAASLQGYDFSYMECVLPVYSGNEQTGTETILIENPRLSGNYYYFTLSGINALEMGNMVEATLYMTKGDVEYCSKTDEFSVATYAYAQLNNSTDEKLRVLCASLLRYGAAAQLYKGYRTDTLVDGDMTEAQKALLVDLSTVTFGNHAAYLEDLSDPSVTWIGRSLVLDTKVVVNFVCNISGFAGEAEELVMRVSYQGWDGTAKTAEISAVKYGTNAGWYAFPMDALLAAELRQPMEAAVYFGDIRLSKTCRFSVDSYGNNCTGLLLEVCQSLIAYSDAALAYFSK